MYRSIRMAVGVGAAAGLLAAGSPSAASPAPADPLNWRACANEPATDCATLRVPVDWHHPEGPRVDLALARRPAGDPDRRVGSLVVNPGGPGGSGVDFVQQGSGMFSADLLARFDIVSWDPRGVGASHPVACDTGLLNEPLSLYPRSQAEVSALAAYHRRLMDSCRADTGPLFDHLDTASNARDLDAIRVALGDQRLTFYGLSYGTLIGEQYAELFPHRIRAMALDSTEDHSGDAVRYVTMLSRAQEDSYAQFADWCLRTSWCPLYPRDPRRALDELYPRAEQGTIFVPGAPDLTIGPTDLLDFVRGELTGNAKWLSLAGNLRAVLDEPITQPAQHPVPVAPLSPDEVAKTAIICEDHAWRDVSTFTDLEELRQAMHAVAPHTHLSTTGFKDVTGCLGWPRPVPNPQHRPTVRGAPPILIVNSRYDVATPYPGAVSAARQIGAGAILLTYDGTSHADYDETPCVAAAVDAYLISVSAPRRGAHCPAAFPASPADLVGSGGSGVQRGG